LLSLLGLGFPVRRRTASRHNNYSNPYAINDVDNHSNPNAINDVDNHSNPNAINDVAKPVHPQHFDWPYYTDLNGAYADANANPAANRGVSGPFRGDRLPGVG